MEVDVMVPSPAVDFNFDSTCTSPNISAPSSPQWFSLSGPASPTRAPSYFCELISLSSCDATDTGGVSKAKDDDGDNDFEFNFSGQLERTSLSADELFDGGKIKPLKSLPSFRDSSKPTAISTRIFKQALSPRRKKKDHDPVTASIEQTIGERNENQQHRERGRERSYDSSSTSSLRQNGTRSLSSFRICDIFSEIESNQQSSDSSTSAKPKQTSKWSLKNLLLFRSASEGRAASKDPLKKYSLLTRSSDEDVKNSSFRSTESAGSTSRRRPPAAAHGLHYAAGRAVAEQMRKTTVLPYKHGLLGCLGFDHALHESSRGFTSLARR